MSVVQLGLKTALPLEGLGELASPGIVVQTAGGTACGLLPLGLQCILPESRKSSTCKSHHLRNSYWGMRIIGDFEFLIAETELVTQLVCFGLFFPDLLMYFYLRLRMW